MYSVYMYYTCTYNVHVHVHVFLIAYMYVFVYEASSKPLLFLHVCLLFSSVVFMHILRMEWNRNLLFDCKYNV